MGFKDLLDLFMSGMLSKLQRSAPKRDERFGKHYLGSHMHYLTERPAGAKLAKKWYGKEYRKKHFPSLSDLNEARKDARAARVPASA